MPQNAAGDGCARVGRDLSLHDVVLACFFKKKKSKDVM